MNDQMSYSDLLDADDVWEDDWYEGDFGDDVLGDDFEDEFDEDFDDDFDEDFDDELSELAESMSGVFASVTPAEAFNIGKAFSQLGKGAVNVLEDPTVRQIAATAAPLAGGAAGTALGGPVGTAVGTSLGTAAGKALAPAPKPQPAAPTAPAKPAPSARGSAAATKALVSTQLPDVLKALCALAAGKGGTTSASGVPVGALMSMVAKQFEQAAEDADELLYAGEGAPSYLLDDEGYLRADPAAPRERADALYAALVGAENEYLTQAGLA